jgi:hypothetical protein
MMKRIYSCDICSEEKSRGQLIGFNFSNMVKFTLASADTTDGKHICKECLKQISEQLYIVGM